MKTMRWLFWRVVYLFRPQPKELLPYLLRGERLRPPWWKFEPYVWHNPDGMMWHVYLADERSYTRPDQTLRVELHIGEESGRVVGFNVFDESLAAEEVTR